jgi:hypothetical protein
MSQQFRIQSEALRDKLNQLLPSQNRGAIGVELSGSTQIIPIVDLTEVASGSNIREDLQTASSINDTVYSVVNASSTVLNTTGYYRFRGVGSVGQANTTMTGTISITDGTTTKVLYKIRGIGSANATFVQDKYDFIIFLRAGESIIINTSNAFCSIDGTFRQIADLAGNLINP